jgi:hypothetical protein
MGTCDHRPWLGREFVSIESGLWYTRIAEEENTRRTAVGPAAVCSSLRTLWECVELHELVCCVEAVDSSIGVGMKRVTRGGGSSGFVSALGGSGLRAGEALGTAAEAFRFDGAVRSTSAVLCGFFPPPMGFGRAALLSLRRGPSIDMRESSVSGSEVISESSDAGMTSTGNIGGVIVFASTRGFGDAFVFGVEEVSLRARLSIPTGCEDPMKI